MGIINADELAKSYKLSLLKKIKAGDLHDDDLFQISSIRTNPKYFDTNAIDLDEFTKYIALKIGEHTGVEVTPYHDSGDKIATIAINGVPIDIYANDIEDVIDKNISGSIVSFDDAAEAPLVKCLVNITAQQAGSGDPSPENERPISGFSEVDVTRCAKNLCFSKIANSSIGTDGIISNSDSYDGYIAKVKAGVTYKISDELGGTSFRHGFFESMPVVGATSYNGGARTVTTIEAPIDGYIYVRNSKDNGAVQIELGTTATSYEPYNGNTFEIEMPAAEGTVYGALIDVLNGKLWVTDKAVDMGDLEWNKTSTGTNPYFYTTLDGLDYTQTEVTVMCSAYKAIAGMTGAKFRGSDYDLQICNITNQASTHNLGVQDSNYTTTDAFKTAVTGQTIVYKLATPIEYDLTPQQISTLLGTNNIWANSGDVDLTYFLKGSQPIIDLINKSSCLPVVSSTDEGKVLTVDSTGTWVAADLPDGSNTEY